MTNEEKREALCKLLGVSFVCGRRGGDLYFRADTAVTMTFQQMMQLPAILGSERLNFACDIEREAGWSEYTPGCEWPEFTITVLGGAHG